MAVIHVANAVAWGIIIIVVVLGFIKDYTPS